MTFLLRVEDTGQVGIALKTNNCRTGKILPQYLADQLIPIMKELEEVNKLREQTLKPVKSKG